MNLNSLLKNLKALSKHSFLCAVVKVAIVVLFLIVLNIFCNVSAQESSQNVSAENQGKTITLADGIRMVLKDSRLIKVALPDEDASYADSLIARSALLPRVSATISENYYKFQPQAKLGSTVAATSQKQFLSFGFDVYQTLFDFRRSLSTFRASQEIIKARKANSDAVRRVAVLEFIAAYFDLLETEKMITVAEKEVESLAAYLGDIEHLFEQGVVVKNDLLPAQVRLADAKQKLISARNSQAIAMARLNTILALPIEEKLVVQDIEMAAPQFPQLEEAWKNAQTLRPEIMFYDDQLRASQLSMKATVAKNFPSLFVDGSYANTENRYQVHRDNMVLQLGAKMNLYDGGIANAELLKERARQTKTQEQKDKLIDDIHFEIHNSYVSLSNACEKVLVAKDVLSQAQENVRVNRVKYAEGSATSTEVLEAITLETKAQTNYYSNDYEVKRTYAKLMYAMGIDLALLYESIERGSHESTKR